MRCSHESPGFVSLDDSRCDQIYYDTYSDMRNGWSLAANAKRANLTQRSSFESPSEGSTWLPSVALLQWTVAGRKIPLGIRTKGRSFLQLKPWNMARTKITPGRKRM